METDDKCEGCGCPDPYKDWDLLEGAWCFECMQERTEGRPVPREWLIED